jgi:hypothetical protein
MSNVRALRMQSLMSHRPSSGVAVSAPTRHWRWLPLLVFSKPSFPSSREQSAFSSSSTKAGRLALCAFQSCRCSTGHRAVSVQVRRTRALRADVLRRAVSSLSRLRGGVLLRSTIAHRKSEAKVSSVLASSRAVACSGQRPNPSIEGTHNGGARCPASATAVAPLCAPHVKR